MASFTTAGRLRAMPAVSCDVPAARAGDPRFPLAAWDQAKASAWLVTGSPACARDLAGELSAKRARGLLALTLEAASLPSHVAGLRVVTASAGVVPERNASDARDDELRRFEGTLGDVSWWTALGRDAATLGRAAVARLPTTLATDAREVADRRAQARAALAVARARLWTTEAAGWTAASSAADRDASAGGGGFFMRRTICVVDAPLP